jgi:hypothetical protein
MVLFGMVMSLSVYILKVYSLCSSFCILTYCCIVSLCFLYFHCCLISVHVVWKLRSKFFIWTSFFMSRAIVLMVSECRHDVVVIGVIVVDPPYLAIKIFVRPLYIVPMHPWSLSAFLNCFPMHFWYVVLKENASIPNRLCGSHVARFGVLLETLHIVFVIAIMCLSSFLMFGMEYGIAQKLYATSILNTMFTIFIFCFIDANSCLLWLSSLSVVICF